MERVEAGSSLSHEFGAFHNFRGSQKCPSAGVLLGIKTVGLQNSSVALSAPLSALPACLISGSCDVQ